MQLTRRLFNSRTLPHCSVKDRMLRRNPLAAMALHHPSRHLADSMPPTTLGLPDPQLQVGLAA